MICPNCGAPLPDTVSMCYSCRMVFRPMNQQPQVGYNAPQAQKRPLIKPTIGELALPVIAWIIAYISCFFPYCEVFIGSEKIFTGYFYRDTWFMIYITIACTVYFVFMFGEKKLHKKIWHILICIIVIFMCMIEETNIYSTYDTSPNKENEALKSTNNLFGLAIFALLLYSIYTIARDYRKNR